ncbi:hypothetical protein QCA50_002555 [Cerrena zonata]|uniref:Uncharacterized protein n=1 Tax=Cerrena zonata TaxID=2478898 RepID=A0AAW0GPN8_9APHY
MYAIYECNRKLLFGLFGLLAAELSSAAVVLVAVLSKVESKLSWTVWFGIFVFESSLGALPFYKYIQNYRDQEYAPQLLKVLLRDSILFYGGVAVVALVNCIIWAFGRPSLFTSFDATNPAFSSILGCRMMLNMQKANRTLSAEATNDVFSSLVFRPDSYIATSNE